MSPFAQCLGSPIALLGGGSAAPSDTILFFLERRCKNQRDAGPISPHGGFGRRHFRKREAAPPACSTSRFSPESGAQAYDLVSALSHSDGEVVAGTPLLLAWCFLIKRSQAPSLCGSGAQPYVWWPIVPLSAKRFSYFSNALPRAASPSRPRHWLKHSRENRQSPSLLLQGGRRGKRLCAVRRGFQHLFGQLPPPRRRGPASAPGGQCPGRSGPSSLLTRCCCSSMGIPPCPRQIQKTSPRTRRTKAVPGTKVSPWCPP